METIFIIRLTRVAITIVFLIAAAIIDSKTRKIPNLLVFTMMFSGLLVNIFLSPEKLPGIGAVLFFCLLFGLLPGVGMGDVKLLMGMSMYLPNINVMLELALASIFVLVVQFVKYPYKTFYYIISRRIKPLKKEEIEEKGAANSVPFAPYLLLATIIIEGGAILGFYIL